MAKEIVIASACRTAIGSFGGTLKNTPAVELGATVIKEAVNRAGLKPEQVDEVIFGNVLQAGLGQNPARQAALKAGLRETSTAFTAVVPISKARIFGPAPEQLLSLASP